jgi:hypothetical protein
VRLRVAFGGGAYAFDHWVVEPMPGPRTLASAVMLPNGAVAIVNGARNGETGFHTQGHPVLEAWLYNASAPVGGRFSVLATTSIPRMYHSSAVLSAPRGDVLVAGCGSCGPLDVAGPDAYRTHQAGDRNEYRVEVLVTGFRAGCEVATGGVPLSFGGWFAASTGCPRPELLRGVMLHPGSDSHSTNLAQRAVPLEGTCKGTGECLFRAPESDATLPAGEHWLFVVCPEGRHSDGRLVTLQRIHPQTSPVSEN